jgi:hypothetical protein
MKTQFDFPLLLSRTITDIPTKYDKLKKRESKKLGEKVYQTYYLTYNLIFSDKVHFTTVNEIMTACKELLKMHFNDLPEMDKMQFELIYRSPTSNFDLDNKAAFWSKVFLDVLKTPTPKQIAKAARYKNLIVSLDKMVDDNVKYMNGYVHKYEKGPLSMTINVYGREKAGNQTELF